MTETKTGNAVYKSKEDTAEANDKVEVSKVVAKGVKDNKFSGLSTELPFHDKMTGCADMDKNAKTKTEYTVTFTYDEDGNITAVDAK